MKKILLFAIVAIISVQQSAAQVTGITVETYYTDNGTVAGYPAGHTTYRIYANLTHTTDRLTSVFGDHNSPLFLSVSEAGIWNHSNGGATAHDNDCASQAISPALEYDSFLTIGYACNSGSANLYALDDPNIATWIDEAFDAVPYGINDITVNTQVGALWFGMHTNPNTQAGDELRVLVAQITTNGEICGTFNFQVFPEYAGTGSEYIEQSGFRFSSAENSSISITTEVVSPTCFGDSDASISVSAAGGTGNLSYSFDHVIYDDITTLSGLTAGTYEVYVRDEIGCVALEMIEIENPQTIFATADVDDITCHDSNDGSIQINHVGGTGELLFSLDDLSYSSSPYFDNLSAGTYNIHVVDANDCAFHSEFEIVLVNPEEILGTLETTNVTCNGVNDGSIIIEVAGGVAPYEFNYGEGYSGENPIVDVPIGTYSVLVKDALGCEYLIPTQAILVESSPISITGLQAIDIEDGIPGGNTNYTVDGGNFPYSFNWTDENGNMVSNSENLPQLFIQSTAGDYTLTITDALGCVLTQTITISYIVGIDEINEGYKMSVFPNPTSGLFTLSFTSMEARNISFQLKDATGRVVRSEKLLTVGGEYIEQIDITYLTSGIYFLETRVDNTSKTIRLVKI